MTPDIDTDTDEDGTDASPRPRRLRQLKISEISLVDRPANPGARVVFWKRDGDPDGDDVAQRLAEATRAMIAKAERAGGAREDYEDRLDELAHRMQQPGQGFAEVYCSVLKSDVGRALYARSKAAPRRAVRPVPVVGIDEVEKAARADSDAYRTAAEAADAAHAREPAKPWAEHFASIWRERADLRAADERERLAKRSWRGTA